MRILYGVNGTGNGHIIKSINIISELQKNGADVDILISGTNYQIDIPFDVKYRFHGISFEYNSKGSIDYVKTALNLNPIRLVKNIRMDVKSYDRVVTDFEPISSWACKLQGKECIGVSHQYSFLSDNVPRPNNKSLIGEFVLNNFAPVTFPIGLHFEKYDSFIRHSIIRSDIKNIIPMNKGHYTIYLPSYGPKYIIDELSKYAQSFEVFAKVDSLIVYKNIKIFPNSKSGFMRSFSTCEGIITSAGFETPSEALFLKKKLMVIPIYGQYEQLCNSESLKRMGVFVGNNISDIKIFLSDSTVIDYKWEDPLSDIVGTIMSLNY